MKKGHRTRHNSAATRRQSTALHKVEALAQLFDELVYLQKIVTVVRVSHDYKLAPCGGNAAHQGAAVALLFYRDEARSQASCDVLRAVSATVIRDNDFTSNIMFGHRSLRLPDASLQRVGFVQAWHYNCQFQRFFFAGNLFGYVESSLRVGFCNHCFLTLNDLQFLPHHLFHELRVILTVQRKTDRLTARRT